MRPFLTIVTRCCDRPWHLNRNIESIEQQIDKDIEQIYIVDEDRKGRYWANQEFRNHTHRIDGKYVFIIDDDCRLINKEFVLKLKEGAVGDPHVIMVQTSRPQIRPKKLPKDDVWGHFNNIRLHSTNCLCYVVRREMWQKYVYAFGTPAAGDWHFLKELLANSSGDKFAWVPGVFSETMQLGRGKKFELKQNIEGWWMKTVDGHKIEDVGDGDWRLRLWKK